MVLYKRGQVWWMSFTFQGQQVRKSTEVENRKLAEKIYNKIMYEIDEGKWFEKPVDQRKTSLELAQKYEEGAFKETKSWRSVQGYLNQLKDFFGSYLLDDITPAVIDDFKQKRKSSGVKPATINRQLNIFKRMLNLAKKRWMWIKDVPHVEMEPNADKKRSRHLSFDEFSRLLGFCDTWLRPIVVVAAWTGLRQGNIINLKKSEVDLFTRRIALDGDHTKNGEDLFIPIAVPAFEALKSTMKSSKSRYVFCDKDGNSYHPLKVQRHFRVALKDAGIEDFRFHDLRHCFASWNRQAGLDLDTLADLMGHKDTRMTRRYAHITPGHLSTAIERLEKSYEKNAITNLSRSPDIEDYQSSKLLN